MRGDGGDEVRQGEFAGLVFVSAPCPRCGALNEDEANTKCRPVSDETGERYCGGEFNKPGVSVQPTTESIAEMDAWVDEQVANDEEKYGS